jgi:hypothetical protein
VLANRKKVDENKCLPGILLKLVDVGYLSGKRKGVGECLDLEEGKHPVDVVLSKAHGDS